MLIAYLPSDDRPRIFNGYNDSLRLDPGLNEVPESQAKFFGRSPDWEALVESNELTELPGELSSGVFSVNSLGKLLPHISDVPTLEGWLKTDGRKGAKEAIADHLKELQPDAPSETEPVAVDK